MTICGFSWGNFEISGILDRPYPKTQRKVTQLQIYQDRFRLLIDFDYYTCLSITSTLQQCTHYSLNQKVFSSDHITRSDDEIDRVTSADFGGRHTNAPTYNCSFFFSFDHIVFGNVRLLRRGHQICVLQLHDQRRLGLAEAGPAFACQLVQIFFCCFINAFIL